MNKFSDLLFFQKSDLKSLRNDRMQIIEKLYCIIALNIFQIIFENISNL